jgi:putative oxidoreductase
VNAVENLSGRTIMMTTNDATAASTTEQRGRTLNIVLWVVQILLAVLLLFVAAPKLLSDPAAVDGFEAIGFGQWLRYAAGVCEVGGAIGLLIPRLSGVAAIALVGLMVCATLTNLFLMPGAAPTAIMTVALGVVFGLVAWGRWPRTKALAASLRS